MQVGLQRIRLVHGPIDDAAGQRANDDVGQRFRIVSSADLAAGDALLDEFDEGVVQVESALDAIAGWRPASPRSSRGRCRRIWPAPRRCRRTHRSGAPGSASSPRSKTTSCRLTSRRSAKCADHVLTGGEVVEERSIGDVSALADLLDGRGRNTLGEKQIEGRREDLLPHLALAPVHSVHDCWHTTSRRALHNSARVLGVACIGRDGFADPAVFEVQPTRSASSGLTAAHTCVAAPCSGVVKSR